MPFLELRCYWYCQRILAVFGIPEMVGRMGKAMEREAANLHASLHLQAAQQMCTKVLALLWGIQKNNSYNTKLAIGMNVPYQITSSGFLNPSNL